MEDNPESLSRGNLFSILIPTWNNIDYLKACISSIRKYSCYTHQIIVHVNEGKDGTLEWLAGQQDICVSSSEENIGVCRALNKLRVMVTTPYILYMNDDMYVCPNWDRFLWDEVKRIGHNAFYISSTCIEPSPQSNCSIKADFGENIHEFDELKLIDCYHSFEKDDWYGATWTPNLVHVEYWDRVKGFSEEFSPGMYSDPDFSMKLWLQGVRIFKGVSASRVYHFGRMSTKRVKQNAGYITFIDKWKMTSSTFSNYFLRRGHPYRGPLPEVELNTIQQIKSFFKRMSIKFIFSDKSDFRFRKGYY